MTCHRQHCPDCGDQMIHQNRRGNGESSSGFGQHVTDQLAHDFQYIDIDGAGYHFARSGAAVTVKIVEHKANDGYLSPSQRIVLPILAVALDLLIVHGKLGPESGVYRVRADPPFTTYEVSRITGHWPGDKPIPRVHLGDPQLITGDDRVRFFAPADPSCLACANGHHQDCDTAAWTEHDEPVPCHCFTQDHYGAQL